MKIYRRLVPKMARDVIRSLIHENVIEIEDGHRDDAEMDIAGAIVGYLNDVEQLTQDARDAIARHQMNIESLVRVKRSMAEKRQLPLGDAAQDHVINKMIEALFDSKHIVEVFGDDTQLRKLIFSSFSKYLGVDVELDHEVRGRLKNLREGTPEWELEYERLISQMRGNRENHQNS